MPYGYCGRVLHVDLTSKGITIEQPGEVFYRKYLGGRNVKQPSLKRPVLCLPDPVQKSG